MTDVKMFKELMEKDKPQNIQIGGSHYMYFDIQPYEFISKNNLISHRFILNATLVNYKP